MTTKQDPNATYFTTAMNTTLSYAVAGYCVTTATVLAHMFLSLV